MDEADRAADRAAAEGGLTRETAHAHAEHLRHRIESLAENIAESEDTLARVYEDAARLRPHDAPRLQEAARQARSYAERERRAVRRGELHGAAEPPTTEG